MTAFSPARGVPTVGVDTGGTFTDFALVEGDSVRFEKVPSTPADPSRALLDGLARLALGARRAHIVHGTTVALNALLTGTFARAALVVNAGFVDLIEIGRQDRPELYALHPTKVPAIAPRELRFEIEQRSRPALGSRALEHVREPTRAELKRLARAVAAARPESIAVCLLHSYAEPRIEHEVARALRELGVPITCSADLVREHREFERFSTAVVNAALVPVLRGYLERLARSLPHARLSLMRSSGGTISAERAALEPVRVLASGPAGGVIGASRAAVEAGFERMVGLDMGGTSTDVAFRRVSGARAAEPVGAPLIAGRPIAVPSLDLHTIGCGGGSLLHVDSLGVLHVGPRSAGAVPGPVCYGVGRVPTITDAHVLLGHVTTGTFLGGRLALDVDAVERAFEKLARRLGLKPREAAQAALDVARAAMRRALGAMTMQRGEDPRRTPLVAFGGAGGLHAAALAAGLGMPCALVPRGPGVLSALGMASADAVAERATSVLAPLASLARAERTRTLAALAKEARAELVDAGCAARAIEIEAALDLRYEGQSFELRVPFERAGADPAAAFHARHRELYGYALEERAIELVAARVRAVVRRELAQPGRVRARELPKRALRGVREAWFGGASGAPVRCRAKLLERAELVPGVAFEGPAIVEEFSGTTLVPPRTRARVTHGEHLELRAVGR